MGEDEDHLIKKVLGGEPITAPYGTKTLPRPPNLPSEVVASVQWGGWYDDANEEIRLIDWGESFSTNETVSRSIIAQPLNLTTPETIFVELVDFKHDLWRAGAMVSTPVNMPRTAPY